MFLSAVKYIYIYIFRFNEFFFFFFEKNVIPLNGSSSTCYSVFYF